tara:strand:+ start:109 stop:234 length:126 start_codon:yes stop_codon:yes gene_type:complete
MVRDAQRKDALAEETLVAASSVGEFLQQHIEFHYKVQEKYR